MKRKIRSQFFLDYLLMFVISIMIGLLALIVLDFANHMLSNSLAKNNYKAEDLMKDDISKIDTSGVVENSGGVQIVNRNYEVILSKGLNTLGKYKLTPSEFTEFLINSNAKGVLYNYSIQYNEKENFWLIITFPSSFRIDLAIVHNKEYSSDKSSNVKSIVAAIIILYLLLLALSTFIYSKLASLRIINPLKALNHSVKKFRDGDYSTRVEHNLKNELGDLADTFNEMAQRIEDEISLRKKSEENRRNLVLYISHDLKNPLASIMGYSELFINKNLSPKEYSDYGKVIYNNSIRANELITGLFEMSKMESSEFKANMKKVDICEYLREEMVDHLSLLDKEGFNYDFDISEEELFVNIDSNLMARVFSNLIYNAVKYNEKGTDIFISVNKEEDNVKIVFKDNGIGLPKEQAENIFETFVRIDNARNSQTGGSGLGLAITKKIIHIHNGTIKLNTDINKGCEFIIKLPLINQ